MCRLISQLHSKSTHVAAPSFSTSELEQVDEDPFKLLDLHPLPGSEAHCFVAVMPELYYKEQEVFITLWKVQQNLCFSRRARQYIPEESNFGSNWPKIKYINQKIQIKKNVFTPAFSVQVWFVSRSFKVTLVPYLGGLKQQQTENNPHLNHSCVRSVHTWVPHELPGCPTRSSPANCLPSMEWWCNVQHYIAAN